MDKGENLETFMRHLIMYIHRQINKRKVRIYSITYIFEANIQHHNIINFEELCELLKVFVG